MASAVVAAVENRFRNAILGREFGRRLRHAIFVQEYGQTMAEYAVVLAVITPLVVAILSLLGASVSVEIGKVASYIKF